MDRLRILELAHRQVAPSDLAGSIAALLSRYKNSLPSENNARTNMRNHWATPPVLMGGLIKSLKLTVERFASPLNFCPEMQQYFSAKEDDQAFGAGVDTYSTPWLGASQANPEYEHAEMAKAVRWAIMSAATTQEASMTIFILPEWTRSAYYRYLQDPRVHRLMVIPKDKFMFRAPDFWSTGRDYASHPKWNINIFVVANVAGLCTYCPCSLRAALGTAIPGLIVPSLPSMHSMKSQLQAACPDSHLADCSRRGSKALSLPPPIGILQIRPLTMSLQAIKRQSSKTQAALYTLTVVLSRMHRDRI